MKSGQTSRILRQPVLVNGLGLHDLWGEPAGLPTESDCAALSVVLVHRFGISGRYFVRAMRVARNGVRAVHYSHPRKVAEMAMAFLRRDPSLGGEH